jgi:NADH dehydrogenase [ubiquinone] 1 alpha subcomplex assembly factor 1
MFIALTWNVEDLMPPTERLIFNFNSREELKKWHLYSDSEYGGKKQLFLFSFSEGFFYSMLSSPIYWLSELNC